MRRRRLPSAQFFPAPPNRRAAPPDRPLAPAAASSSTVAFPVESYLERIKRLAEEAAAQHRAAPSTSDAAPTSDLPPSPQGAGAPAGGRGLAALPPDEAVAAVVAWLIGPQRLRVAQSGRSALPARALLTHPGTYESAAPAYLNEVRPPGQRAAGRA